MRICILGSSHAPNIFREAAHMKGIETVDIDEMPELVMASEDSPVADDGKRDLTRITEITAYALNMTDDQDCPVVLTSQVTPGFTREFETARLYHMAETLRTKDAAERALNPEQLIIGCEDPSETLPQVLLNYLQAFKCPIHQVTWEEAEFSKIAINMRLARMVESTNELAEACKRIPGCKWSRIADILRHDKRIGPQSYLEPGDWRKSKNILRDATTLSKLVPEAISRVAGRITIPTYRWGGTRLG